MNGPETLICLVRAGPRSGARGRSWECFLSRRERAEMTTLAAPWRRQEWLTGRLVVKYAVSCVVNRLGVGEMAPAEIEVSRGDRGEPVLTLLGVRERPPTSISISHSGNLFACAVQTNHSRSRALVRIGLDTERIDAGFEELVDRICTERERAGFCRAGGGAVRAALLWSFKEAAIKYVGGVTARRKSFAVDLRRAHTARIDLRGVPGRWPRFLCGDLLVRDGQVVTWVRRRSAPSRIIWRDIEAVTRSLATWSAARHRDGGGAVRTDSGG